MLAALTLLLTLPALALAADFAVVRGGRLNLRQYPSSSSQSLGKYDSGSWVDVQGQGASGWYAVRTMDGKTGYMAGNYLTFAQSGSIGTVAYANGGYVNLLDECWKMCEKFHTNIVIMYDHVSCKNVGGLHGLFEDQARERGIHLIWIPHDVMDPRTVSRREMREAFSQYMVTVLNEKPLDPTLLDYEDALSW